MGEGIVLSSARGGVMAANSEKLAASCVTSPKKSHSVVGWPTVETVAGQWFCEVCGKGVGEIEGASLPLSFLSGGRRRGLPRSKDGLMPVISLALSIFLYMVCSLLSPSSRGSRRSHACRARGGRYGAAVLLGDRLGQLADPHLKAAVVTHQNLPILIGEPRFH